MKKLNIQINWKAASGIIVIMAVMLFRALNNIAIDTDVLKSLPSGDRVIEDAQYIFRNHPVQDQVVVDVAAVNSDPDTLVHAAGLVEAELSQSGYFSGISTRDMQDIIPGLMEHVLQNLPVLFSASELKENIEPLLGPDNIKTQMQAHLQALMGLDGIGRSGFITRDPLGFSGSIFKKLQQAAPSEDAVLYRGHILSADKKHLLLVSRVTGSATDSAFSQKLEAFFNDLQVKVRQKYPGVTLAPVGAYRPSLDNERAARSDTKRAVLFATIGIIILVVVSFPRPILGLFALVPALFGTAAALFIFSLFNDSISVMALGFGGALISITVDHGIAYMLFLDRPSETTGISAAHEVRSVGLIATLTSVGAFSALYLSGFSILAHIGLFAALGIACSFLFVHTLFPRMFPVMSAARTPARSGRGEKIISRLNKLVLSGSPVKAAGAGIFLVIMLFFARPDFQMDLNSMNSVGDETLRAEELLQKTWGDIFNRVYIMARAESISELRELDAELTRALEKDISREVVKSALTPAMLFPDHERAENNLKAWRTFWTRGRITALRRNFTLFSEELGFSPRAFNPFFKSLSAKAYTYTEIPEKVYPLLGISRKKDGQMLLSTVTVVPGKQYNARSFYQEYAHINNISIFDAGFFSQKLGAILASTFFRMLLIIGISVSVLVLLFFADLALALLSLLPIVFSLVSTMGILSLMGHIFGIPDLMLSIVVIGMGVDYSLYMVKSVQRYGTLEHESVSMIKTAVMLASGSTLIGFGVLIFARHAMLKSAGLTCFMGIGFSLLGAFLILPFFLKRIFTAQKTEIASGTGVKERRKSANRRYRHLEAYPRIFARMKMLTDPLCTELERYVEKARVILDIGTGYGVPLAWILSYKDDATVYGLEPDPERARIADRMIGGKGFVRQGGAPGVPDLPQKADAVVMLDMLHYINDAELKQTLDAIKKNSTKDLTLIMRVTVPRPGPVPLFRRFEVFRMKVMRQKHWYRTEEDITALLNSGGFKKIEIAPSGKQREEVWVIARP